MRSRLLLLGGQAIALGLSMAFLVVPASSIFLATYGAEALPYTYLCVAVAGVAVSTLMARAQRTWSLARLEATVLASYALLVTCAWLLLSLAGATWVTFPLVVLFPLSIPVGFVLIGTQSGRLLDVRQMKAHFPRVVAGFSVGFAIGGLAAARLVGPLGGPENLLLVDVAAALAFLCIGVITGRRYPAELATPPPPREAVEPTEPRDPQLGLRSLLRNRMVVLIFGYQLLSAAVTQLLDFMVWERAAARYPDPSDLASFLGVFGAVINIVSVAFVFLLAGVLLTRYGIRFGLAANPAGVLLLLVVTATVGFAVGPASTAFFLLVCAQQVTDIAFTDGTTRTSVNATYQALPAAQRAAAQTWVEGVGFPLALGFVGVLLLVSNAFGTSIVALVVVTGLFTVVWLALGIAAYQGYGTNLRQTLTRRAWDPIALRLDDESRGVVDQLVASGDVSDLRVGLDVLADTDDPRLSQLVGEALNDPDPERRLVAVSAAVHATRATIDSSWVVPLLEPLRSDPDETVRTAAVVALAGEGSESDRQASRRAWVAALSGDDPAACRSALAAACSVPSPDYVPALIALARVSSPPDLLPDALAAHADFLAPTTDAALRAPTTDLQWRPLRLLIGALGESGQPAARAILVRHLDHPDLQVADAVLAALLAGGRVTADDRPAVATLVGREGERMARVLSMLDAVAPAPGADHVVRGLRDEVNRSRHRGVGLLSLLHGHTSLSRTVRQLDIAGGDRPLALETLEVTVGRGTFPLALALLDPTLDDPERLRRLTVLVGVTPIPDAATALRNLIDDPGGEWRDPWLRACALHALVASDPSRARAAAAALLDDPDATTAETATWVMASTGVG